MKKWSLGFAVLLFLVCFGLMATLKMDISCCRMFPAVSSKISGLNENNSVAIAHVYIEHARRGDLIVDAGVGDPDNPEWSINIWNREGGEEHDLNLTVDVSEAAQYLPPSESNRWFLKVYDARSENVGQIVEFAIGYQDQTYNSTCIPVRINDAQTSYSHIPGVPLELAISRRISIRKFPPTENYTLPEVSWELLSKVLWAGYGYSSWERTVPNICGNYSLVIYVCNKTAIYKYKPETQSLDLWKEGDYRWRGHYYWGEKWVHPAPIELFVTMDTNMSDDIYLGAMEAGCAVQNIYLQANTLGLGTVCVGGVDRDAIHDAFDLPANEFVLYNMPLGHPVPSSFYNFTCVDPPESSELPQVKQSSVFLEYALRERRTSHDWSETPLTSQETSQILWSAYGISYLRDLTKNMRHRVVASAHGRYPLKIWMANSTGVYVYNIWNHRTYMEIEGDKRAEIARAAGANWMASAPTMLVVVWNSSRLERQDWAYTEVGFVIQNVHLESVAWGLAADRAKVVDEDALKAVLGLVEQTDLHPVTVITVGRALSPIAYFTYSPINPLANETVAFNATLSTPNGGTIINYTWDFGDGFYGEGMITYHNYSETGTYNATLTVIDSEGLNHTAWATVAVLIHGVAVLSVAPSTNEIYEGQTLNITVVVQNNGNFTETFNVTAYANTTIIQTLTASDLAPANQTTLTFLWNTTGVSLGNYTISAEASAVPGETYATDNVKVNGTVNVIPELASILLLFIVFLATTIVTITIKKRLLKKGAQRH